MQADGHVMVWVQRSLTLAPPAASASFTESSARIVSARSDSFFEDFFIAHFVMVKLSTHTAGQVIDQPQRMSTEPPPATSASERVSSARTVSVLRDSFFVVFFMASP
jgi:hypothetical protein